MDKQKLRLLKSRRLMILSFFKIPRTIKVLNNTMAAIQIAWIKSELNQPLELPRSRKTCKQPIQVAIKNSPIKSILGFLGSVSVMDSNVKSKAMRQTGTLI